ncbi:Uncharacterised protein at_DN0039 [Pycnogonum litorale]
MISYADDTTVYTKLEDSCDIKALQITINEIQTWSTENSLHLNASKTKLMHLSVKTNQFNNLKLSISGDNLELIDEFKFLGIIIDKNLNFKKHVEYILNKVRTKFYFLCRAKKSGLNIGDQLTLYTSLITPILDYGCAIWSSMCNAEYILKIEKFEKRCLRIIYDVTNSNEIPEQHLNNLFRNRSMKARKRLLQRIMKNGSMKDHLPKLRGQHNYDLRMKNKLQHVTCQKSKFWNSFLPTAIRENF